MFGVFVALDLMLYYGFWELSLVPWPSSSPCTAAKTAQGRAQILPLTFIPSARCSSPFCGSMRARTLSTSVSFSIKLQRVLPAGALFWVALAFLFAFAVKVPVFPLHGWLADTYNEAPVALAMVVAGKLGLYSMIRFHVGLFPAQARALAPVLIVLAVIAFSMARAWRLSSAITGV